MKDLSNKKFGKLTVLKFLKTDSHYNSFWLCKCDCGNEIVARADHLQRGGTKGQEYTLSELADKLGIEYKHFWYLIKKGKLKEMVGEDK